jgi:membrane-associated phospholipid phosphatase
VTRDRHRGWQRDRRWLLAAVALLVVVAAALIAVTSGWLGPHSVDDRSVTAAHRLVRRHHWLLTAAQAVTRVGAPRVVDGLAIIVTVVLLLCRRWRAAGFIAVVRLITALADNGLKVAVARARPVLSHPFTHAHGYSFPSGHASGAASIYLPIAVLLLACDRAAIRRSAVALAVAICLLVATSRVLLGVHFPSDVLAGLALGAALTCAGSWLILADRGNQHSDGGITQGDHDTKPIG